MLKMITIYRLFPIVALALVLSAPIRANETVSVDPGIKDTLRIDTVAGFRGGKVVVPVHIYNDEKLGGVEFVLEFDPTYLTLDSVSFVGGVAQNFPAKFTIIDSVAGTVDAAAFALDSSSAIQPGSAYMAGLHFSLDLNTPVGFYGLDTTSIDPPGPALKQTVFSTLQTDTAANESVFPQFRMGGIAVPERPATVDSIAVAEVTGAQGHPVVVPVTLNNEATLTVIKLPLTYTSSALILDSVSFAGTRGILAGKSRLAQRQDPLHQVLITLEYFDTAPLNPGFGPIANLFFRIADTAANQVVPIDTATFLGVVGLSVKTNSAEGNVTFIPSFDPGSVTVDLSTDVGDEDDPSLPRSFALAQNYPNPFNPSTTIEFSLPRSAHVQLEIFNVLGQNVATLVNATLSAGRHEVIFDTQNVGGNSLSSGVYFYRLKAGDFVTSRKMTLLK